MNQSTDNVKRGDAIDWRRRLLYGAAVLVLGLYFLDVGYRRYYEEPIRAAESRKTALQKQIRKGKLELAKAKRATQILPELQQRALPYDLERARSSYQSWLLSLVEKSSLSAPKVDSGEPITHAANGQILYQTISFSVRGRGNMRQITQLLYDFYSAGHLQKIRTLSFSPVGAADLVDVSIAIEAIALPTADRESELSSVLSERLASSNVMDYQSVARRNLFQAGGASLGQHITLTAVTSSARNVLEAWFHDARSDQTFRLSQGGRLEIGSLIADVTEINKTQVTVALDKQLWPVTIGQNLAEAQAVATQTAATE